MSIRRACGALEISRTVYRYQPQIQRKDKPVIEAILALWTNTPVEASGRYSPCSVGRVTDGIINASIGYIVD